MRAVLALFILAMGVALGLVSYFFLAARLGIPTHEGFSNPRVPFAPTLFIAGVMLVFVSAMVFELFPGRRRG